MIVRRHHQTVIVRRSNFFIQIKFYFVYDVQWSEDQCLIFANNDQGYDHFPTSARSKAMGI